MQMKDKVIDDGESIILENLDESSGIFVTGNIVTVTITNK